MIFKKTGRMIDIRELQRRGVVKIPKEEINIPTTNDGFVELENNGNITPEKTPEPTSNTEFFGFMNSNDTSTTTTDNFSTEKDGYNKREVDGKISDLDNKIYKLENRMELLEKKLDINQPSNPTVGVMGW
ncbi:hypothetical protein KAS08_00165 [Candidatus Pacearchaeota archaeon]|nr:hypothetical protein [Candidatus Pacearchaeota archaeon]